MAREYDHGTHQRYSQGCRCAACKAAWARRAKERRDAARTRQVPEHVHGTVNGFTNWSCRCARCRQAQREHNAALSTTQKEALNSEFQRGFKAGVARGREIERSAWINDEEGN